MNWEKCSDEHCEGVCVKSGYLWNFFIKYPVVDWYSIFLEFFESNWFQLKRTVFYFNWGSYDISNVIEESKVISIMFLDIWYLA